MNQSKIPMKQGLYNPIFERDACGIGFIANLNGESSHQTVKQGIEMLCRLEHRGGQGSDPNIGDGAGILTKLPHTFFQKVCPDLIKEEGEYAVGMVFLPQDATLRNQCEDAFEKIIVEEGCELLGWRTVPTNDEKIGVQAKESQPFMRQFFIGKAGNVFEDEEFERKLYIIRKRTEKMVKDQSLAGDDTFYVASLSSRTIVYKGMLTPEQLEQYYLDLQDESFQSAFVLVHSRYSTNTFPSWERAHPNRMLIHNGEINTLTGNVSWMKAREKRIASSLFGEKTNELLPIIDENGSDSSSFDNCLEFLVRTGRSLPHAAMMMVPEPWEKDELMDDSIKAFYEFHSHLMEPWDGPGAFAFTDGLQIGAMQDRNGLRPARYYITVDGTIIFASEAGVIDLEPEQVVVKGRLSPGKMLLVDLKEGRIIPNEEIKKKIASEQPYRELLNKNSIHIEQLEVSSDSQLDLSLPLSKYYHAFGYTVEELKKVISDMAVSGKEPINSMGNDMPVAVLSNHSQLLYNYFRQLFAQVTNPPIDAIREEFVTSTTTYLGREGDLLEPNGESCRRIRLETPILSDGDLAKIRENAENLKSITFPILFKANEGKQALESSLHQLFAQVDDAISNGYSIVILSDRDMNDEFASIPALLAASGLHHHLVRQGSRTKVSIIVETGEARDVHQLALLIGYGADAINPYLVFASLREMVEKGELQIDETKAAYNYRKAATDGIVKIMSKMGISTIQSYRGAQIFEAIGLSSEVVDQYFTGTTSALGGIGLETIAEETLMRHEIAFGEEKPLKPGSDFQYRKDGETHAFNPEVIKMLKTACRNGDYELYKKYAEKANEGQFVFIRDLLAFKKATPIPLDEVEPVESIVRRFKTGAMSYGSLSQEAHEVLAIAMNRIGGKSNSGEGGEHPSRYQPDANGDLRRSAIKQVASGRFGVTSQYLVNCDEIQIKMAQGAKPGEGGQLPGHKVYPWIAEVRGTTPGVGLISPPPHHDIYSIEDLAQLIFDLKNSNPSARISVKLVAKAGVGTIAAGVAKGLADVILISGADGGTGAAPRSSIKHAGIPWEIGLAETHQTLLLNGLRDRVILEVDGKLMTGRDIVMAALLGAEEFGFASSALVVLGCVMVRQCHLNTCPVGIATQDPELRKKFLGKPEDVENFMRFIAQDVREIMAQLGFRTINEMVGRTDLLVQSKQAKSHWKAKYVNISPLLYQPPVEGGRYNLRQQNHGIENTLDYKELLNIAKPALDNQEKVKASFPIQNINRTVGTILGSEISKRYGGDGLPEDTIQLTFTGSAGLSFGSFLPKGVTLNLVGDANDYIGKGLSGGKIVVCPSEKSIFVPEENTIIGNVAFYGATSGEAYIRGLAGERFCVRNSGVEAVVEGIGDHGCEYMTGGTVVILGDVGKNFAAGMSGGIAYVFVEDKDVFNKQCNHEMVDIDPLVAEEDISKLKQLVQNHYKYTNSTRAVYLLNHWEENLAKWVKVIPKEYKRVLQQANGEAVPEMQHQ